MATSARDDATNKRNEAETFRDQALAFRNEAETFRDQAQTFDPSEYVPLSMVGTATGQLVPVGSDGLLPTSVVPLPGAASTSSPGVVQLNDTVTSTSTTQAATANAAKVAYDRGTQALNAANSKVNLNPGNLGVGSTVMASRTSGWGGFNNGTTVSGGVLGYIGFVFTLGVNDPDLGGTKVVMQQLGSLPGTWVVMSYIDPNYIGLVRRIA